MELFEELNHQNAPGAFFKGTGDSSVEVNIYEQWKDIVSFFNLMVATDADLADSRSE